MKIGFDFFDVAKFICFRCFVVSRDPVWIFIVDLNATCFVDARVKNAI